MLAPSTQGKILSTAALMTGVYTFILAIVSIETAPAEEGDAPFFLFSNDSTAVSLLLGCASGSFIMVSAVAALHYYGCLTDKNNQHEAQPKKMLPLFGAALIIASLAILAGAILGLYYSVGPEHSGDNWNQPDTPSENTTAKAVWGSLIAASLFFGVGTGARLIQDTPQSNDKRPLLGD